jgi:polyhydroxybutyrate depolymerase
VQLLRRWTAAVLGVAMCTSVVAAGAPATAAAGGPTLGASANDLPSAGCGSSTVVPGDADVPTTSGGVVRSYLRHVPPQHDGSTPLPLVVDIHGYLQGAMLQRLNSDWLPRADRTGFVVVYPQGIDNVWNVAIDGPDVAFIGDILDEVEAQLCIDTNRIYVTGFSLGALMTSTVACVYADRVAAVAPVAWARYPVSEPRCQDARPVPFITIHGTLDNWVPYGPIPGNVAAWAQRNGCATPPVSEPVPGDAVVTITRLRYACPTGTGVFYDIEHGGHAWPGSEFSRSIVAAVGYTTFAFNASDVIWNFFAPYRAQPGIVTYTARFAADTGARLDALSAATGLSVEELVRHGVEILVALADAGAVTPGPAPPNDGTEWVTVRWTAAEWRAVERAARAWGVTGDELHEGGGEMLLAVIAALAGADTAAGPRG